jgi:hypothetical protein
MDYKFILHTQRSELVNKLQKNTIGLFMNGIFSIYEHVKRNNKIKRNLLKEFQKSLADISIWSREMIRNEHQRFQASYPLFDKNIHKIFAIQKHLHHSKDNQQIDCADFLHQCYLNIARSLWKQPFLVYDVDIDKLTIQKNKLKIEKVIMHYIKDTFDHFIAFDDEDEDEDENADEDEDKDEDENADEDEDKDEDKDEDYDVSNIETASLKSQQGNDPEEEINISLTTETENQAEQEESDHEEQTIVDIDEDDFNFENTESICMDDDFEQMEQDDASVYTESELSTSFVDDNDDNDDNDDDNDDNDDDNDDNDDNDEVEDDINEVFIHEHKVGDDVNSSPDETLDYNIHEEIGNHGHELAISSRDAQNSYEHNDICNVGVHDENKDIKSINLFDITDKHIYHKTKDDILPQQNDVKIVNYDEKAGKVKSLLSLKKKVKTSMLNSHIHNPSFF